METTYDFDRFVAAQDAVYDNVLTELEKGRKTSHWMWYVFPQLEGLGRSQTSQFYAIADRDEAAAYLEHPVLGKRLIQCTKLAIKHRADGAEAIFGRVDALKFHSSITLFSRVKGASPVFESALFGFYGGIGDQQTLRMLRLAYIETLDDE